MPFLGEVHWLWKLISIASLFFVSSNYCVYWYFVLCCFITHVLFFLLFSQLWCKMSFNIGLRELKWLIMLSRHIMIIPLSGHSRVRFQGETYENAPISSCLLWPTHLLLSSCLFAKNNLFLFFIFSFSPLPSVWSFPKILEVSCCHRLIGLLYFVFFLIYLFYSIIWKSKFL